MLVVSDIHGNLPALEAVLDDAPGADTVICCGDLTGYYPWPDDVVGIAREQGFLAVRGNHDEAIITGSTFGMAGAAATAARWTTEAIADDTRAFLEKLPYTRREAVHGVDVLVAHGSPRAPVEEYVYPDTVSEQFLQEQNIDADILLLGHTHVPFAKTVADTLVVNPGSVGQPRDGDPRAAYAVVDLAEQTADIHRVEYPVAEVQEAVRGAGLPDELAARLEHGR